VEPRDITTTLLLITQVTLLATRPPQRPVILTTEDGAEAILPALAILREARPSLLHPTHQEHLHLLQPPSHMINTRRAALPLATDLLRVLLELPLAPLTLPLLVPDQ
jgi:hypothetical protein